MNQPTSNMHFVNTLRSPGITSSHCRLIVRPSPSMSRRKPRQAYHFSGPRKGAMDIVPVIIDSYCVCWLSVAFYGGFERYYLRSQHFGHVVGSVRWYALSVLSVRVLLMDPPALSGWKKWFPLILLLLHPFARLYIIAKTGLLFFASE